MQKQQPLAADLLQDEALSSKQPSAESLRKRDRQIDVSDRRKIGVALREHRVAVELDGEDLAGDGIRKRHAPALRLATKDAHEHRFAREKLAHEALHQPALHAR